jgi:NAD-dependent deacetylase
MLEAQAENLASFLRSKDVVVFTGAGMSTASGLPDFRGKDGLWKEKDPALLASVGAFENNYREFCEFYRWRIKALLGAKPNEGHFILAEWEKKGYIKGIITQNVDGFHQAAGSRNVWELHGTLRKVRCSKCRKRYESSLFLERSDCPECGGKLRPDVVLFGESLPSLALEKAEKLSLSCGCFLVLGSSLRVSPANWFPSLAKRNGSMLYIINNEPTPLDNLADGVNRQDILRELEAIRSVL